jgi:undecaprenyl-diphosphatase
MDFGTLVDALVLGLVEGLTEFIPVSSTGHILLLGHFLGFESTGRTFEVLIQLGAILAILTVYFRRFWAIALALPSNPQARRFVYGIVIAFLPAAVLGVALHGIIKTVLFESPALICTTLLLGGIVLLVLDRVPLKPRYRSAYELSPRLALGIGICQTMAMVPGVSRSGATIVGAMLLGVEKRAAAEFSFFLALPTMAGAFAYDLYKNRDALSIDDGLVILVGFVVAFLAALVVVRRLLDFVARRGYAPFGWWRIAVAVAGFAGLIATGELDPAAPFARFRQPLDTSSEGRLVTTTTIRAEKPVGDLPIGPDAMAPRGTGAAPSAAPDAASPALGAGQPEPPAAGAPVETAPPADAAEPPGETAPAAGRAGTPETPPAETPSPPETPPAEAAPAETVPGEQPASSPPSAGPPPAGAPPVEPTAPAQPPLLPPATLKPSAVPAPPAVPPDAPAPAASPEAPDSDFFDERFSVVPARPGAPPPANSNGQ